MAYSLRTTRKQAVYDAAVEQILKEDTDGNTRGQGRRRMGRGRGRGRGAALQNVEDISSVVSSRGRGRPRSTSRVSARGGQGRTGAPSVSVFFLLLGVFS